MGRGGDESKRALLDNTYAFHDEGLPEWFAQDMRPALELAEEDMAEDEDVRLM